MFKEKKYLICSMCLLGVNCRYNNNFGKYQFKENTLRALENRYSLIPVCPEQLGGLATPRLPSEIKKGDGKDLIEEKEKVYVVDKRGNDVTMNFIKGAKEVYKLADIFKVKYMIVHPNSPSCSYNKIYNGNFENKLINGIGVTTAYLKSKLDIEIIEIIDIDKILI